MNILLLSAYHAQSHKVWCQALQAGFPEYEFTELTLPARHFSWRIRGAPLTWTFAEASRLTGPYDLVVATSMVDLATLRGTNPGIASTPTVLYFHENQFAYPSPEDKPDRRLEAQMVQLYATVAADRVVFNSEYNRSSFFAGLSELLRKLPDGVPSHLVATLRDKSTVVPVPVAPVPPRVKPRERFQLVWNHRWEYDKGPELLLEVLAGLNADAELSVHIVGQQFRSSPPAFLHIERLLKERNWLGSFGYVGSREQYARLLGQCHLVLSTALHDFQGLAIIEAVAAGCVPVVPDGLAYPEFIGPKWRYQSGSAAQACALIHQAMDDFCHKREAALPEMTRFEWATLKPLYQSLLQPGAGLSGELT